MRVAWALAGVVLVEACGASAGPPQPPLSPDSLSQAPPGFYPGRGSKITADQATAWADFLAYNRSFIGEVERDRADRNAGGCVGHSRTVCLATLSRTLVVATGFSTDPGDQDLSKPRDPDSVSDDGTPSDPLERVAVYGPGVGEPLFVTIVDSDDRVIEMSSDLPVDPIKARSESNLKATMVYEIAAAALGPGCALGTEVAFYRELEAWSPETTENHPGGRSFRTTVAKGVLCGARVSFATTIDLSGSSKPGFSLIIGEP